MKNLKVYAYLQASKNKHSPIPVSMGLISEFGTMFYAEFTDVPYRKYFSKQQRLLDHRNLILNGPSEFVIETTDHFTGAFVPFSHRDNRYMKDRSENIAWDLGEWFMSELKLAKELHYEKQIQMVIFGSEKELKLFQTLPWVDWHSHKLADEFRYERDIDPVLQLIGIETMDPQVFINIDRYISQFMRDSREILNGHEEFKTALYQVLFQKMYYESFR